MGENERTTDYAILTHKEADDLRRSTTDNRSLAPQTESKQNSTDTKENRATELKEEKSRCRQNQRERPGTGETHSEKTMWTWRKWDG